MGNLEDKEEFKKYLGIIRDDFAAYTSSNRTRMREFCMLVIVVNWAVFGKLFEGNTLASVMKSNYDIVRSVGFAVLGIFLLIIYNFFYSVYLKYEDGRLQKDYSNSKERFSKRDEFTSSYPFASFTDWLPLVVDFVVFASAGLGFYYFWRAL